MNQMEKAKLLIDQVTKALEAGVEHESMYGDKLTTVDEVLKALRQDGEIRIKDPDQKEGSDES